MDELLNRYQHHVAALTFQPSTGGVFEVEVGGARLFSKKEIGRFPEPGEVAGLLARHLGWE